MTSRTPSRTTSPASRGPDIQSSTRGISFIGPMGSGKSTVARILAARLGREFIDTDDLVEQASGRTVSDIIRNSGEERFRDLEEQAVIDATSVEGAVVACGGGVVVRPGNVQRLRQHGLVIYLRVSLPAAIKRIGDGSARPLLNGDPVGQMERLMQSREELYQAASDAVIDADPAAEQVVDELIGLL